MDTRDAAQRLRQAEELFASKDYQGALALLEGMEKDFPGEKRVLYGRAKCLACLSRRAEAMMLLDDLVARYHDAKAQVLKDQIMALPDEVIAPGSKTASHKILRASPFTAPGGRGQAVLGVTYFFVAAAIPLLGSMGFSLLINLKFYPITPASALAMFIFMALNAGGIGIAAFWTISGQLPGDGFFDNFRILLPETALMILLSMVPVIGWTLGVMRMTRRYELSYPMAGLTVIWCLTATTAGLAATMAALGMGGMAWLASSFV